MSNDTRPIDEHPLIDSFLHAAAIKKRLLVLQSAYKDCMDQLEIAVSRHPFDIEQAVDFYDFCRESKISSRKILDAGGRWNAWHIAAYKRGEKIKPPAGTPVVYLLMRGREVVYIGRSKNFSNRLQQHKKDKIKIFDLS